MVVVGNADDVEDVGEVPPVVVVVGRELELELTTTPAGPATEVVRLPDSTYTPLK